MNDPWTLYVYSQMMIFKSDFSREHLVFDAPSHTRQLIILTLDHRPELSLEYEYNKLVSRALVSRPDFWPNNVPFEPSWGQTAETQQNAEFSSLSCLPDLEQNIQTMTKGQSQNVSLPPGYLLNERHDQVPIEDDFHDWELWASLDISATSQLDQLSHSLEYQPPRMPQSRAGSRAGSMHSARSNQSRGGRVGKLFSRTSSINSGASSMYSFFDSKSNHSNATVASTTSIRSRRAMDKAAKVALKAIKAFGGACWRCKFFRKPVCHDQLRN